MLEGIAPVAHDVEKLNIRKGRIPVPKGSKEEAAALRAFIERVIERDRDEFEGKRREKLMKKELEHLRRLQLGQRI